MTLLDGLRDELASMFEVLNAQDYPRLHMLHHGLNDPLCLNNNVTQGQLLSELARTLNESLRDSPTPLIPSPLLRSTTYTTAISNLSSKVHETSGRATCPPPSPSTPTVALLSNLNPIPRAASPASSMSSLSSLEPDDSPPASPASFYQGISLPFRPLIFNDGPASHTRSRPDHATTSLSKFAVTAGYGRDGQRGNKKRGRASSTDSFTDTDNSTDTERSKSNKKQKRAPGTRGNGGSEQPPYGGGNDRGCPPKAPSANQLATRYAAERALRDAATDERRAQELLHPPQDEQSPSPEGHDAITDDELTDEEHGDYELTILPGGGTEDMDGDHTNGKKKQTRKRRPWRGVGASTKADRAHLISIRDSPYYSSQQANTFVTKLCNVKLLSERVDNFYSALDDLLHNTEPSSTHSSTTITGIYVRLTSMNSTATAARFLMMVNSTLFVIKCQKRAAELDTKKFQPTSIFNSLSGSDDFPEELRNSPSLFALYYNYGETMAYLASGFSYYGLMAMAILGEAPTLGNINRCIAPDDVMRVARICRIPSGTMKLHNLLRDVFIPAMKLLSQYRIEIPSLWDGMQSFYIDDLVSSDHFLDNATYHALFMSKRSEYWDGFQHVATASQPLPSAAASFIQEVLLIEKADRQGKRNPWEGQDKREWAEQRRADAIAAPRPLNLLDLRSEMEKRSRNSYVRITPEATEGSTLSFLTSDNVDDWVAHYITDIPADVKTRFVKNMAAYFEFEAQNIESAQNHMPSAIHCGMYARHRRDTHPLVREGAESKEHNDLASDIPSIAEEFLDHLMARLKQLIPAEYEKLWTYVDVMPFAANAGVGPFLSFVINIHFSTNPHYDPLDATNTCVAIQLTDCEGGDLILHEAGLVFHLGAGDVLVFRSASQTHFNLHYRGQRVSMILQSDKDLRAHKARVDSGDANVSTSPSFQ